MTGGGDGGNETDAGLGAWPWARIRNLFVAKVLPESQQKLGRNALQSGMGRGREVGGELAEWEGPGLSYPQAQAGSTAFLLRLLNMKEFESFLSLPQAPTKGARLEALGHQLLPCPLPPPTVGAGGGTAQGRAQRLKAPPPPPPLAREKGSARVSPEPRVP